MITTGMLKRQVWMADGDEFEYIVKNSQRVLRLNNQYEYHPYFQEFTKECNVMFVYGTYVLEGEADAKFSLGDIWHLFQEDALPNNASNFCRQMINFMKAWNYQQKTLDLPRSTEIIKQTHKITIDGEKDVLAKEYRKSPAFAGYHIFAPAGYIERYMKDAIFRLFDAKGDHRKPLKTRCTLVSNVGATRYFLLQNRSGLSTKERLCSMSAVIATINGGMDKKH